MGLNEKGIPEEKDACMRIVSKEQSNQRRTGA